MAGDQHAEVNMALISAIVAVATIGGFLFGFDSGVINGTIDGLQIAFGSNDVGTGFNVASMLLGCAVGAFAAGSLADVLGRRNTLLIAALFFIVSAFGSGIASSSAEFVIEYARSALQRSAGDDHRWPHSGVFVQLFAGQLCRRLNCYCLAWL